MSKTPPELPRLNGRQQKFVDAYIAGASATESAKVAGYSAKVAGTSGPRLLKNPAVKANLDARRAQATEAAQSKAEKLVEEWEHRVYFDPGRMFDGNGVVLELKKMAPEVRRQISAIEIGENGRPIKLKLWSKESASLMLGKYHRMFTEQVEIAGRDGTPVVVNIDLGAGA